MNLFFKFYKFIIQVLTVFIPTKEYREKFRHFFLVTVLIINKNVKVDKGINNKFIVFDDDYNEVKNIFVKNLAINFIGNNNLIKIHKNTLFVQNTIITCTNDNKVFIDKCDSKRTYPLRFSVEPHLSEGCQLNIGKNCYIGGAAFCLFDEPKLSITIGDNCMLSDNIYFRVSDGHTILDKESNKIINYPENITVGNHVWIGHSVRILKGSNIPDNSIVGIGSIYTKNSNKNNESDCIFAGIPAKVIKTGINWDHKNVSKYKMSETLADVERERE